MEFLVNPPATPPPFFLWDILLSLKRLKFGNGILDPLNAGDIGFFSSSCGDGMSAECC
jgi:hypothetical protein